MPTTIREVAERAGVSVSTVSRVLNDYPFVSEEARGRVLEAMDALAYRPDVAARSMRTGTSRAIGFVVSDISNPLFATIAMGVDTVLHPQGYSLVLGNSQNDAEREAELLLTLRQRRVDGIIVAAADEEAPALGDRLGTFAGTVLFDREVSGSTADAVCSDHELGMAEALGRLAALGHRRVGLIAGNLHQLGSRARIVAYRKHVALLGLDEDEDLIRSVEPRLDAGRRATFDVLALPDRPTALIVGHNQLIVGALEALREQHVAVADDLSVIACDDVDLTRLHEPPIDVIERDLLDLGRAAAELLLERLENREAPPRRVALPTRLVLRASTVEPTAALGRVGAR